MAKPDAPLKPSTAAAALNRAAACERAEDGDTDRPASMKAGWGTLLVGDRFTMKAHWFEGRRSLCGRYLAIGEPRWETNQADGDAPDRGTCVACWRQRRKGRS